MKMNQKVYIIIVNFNGYEDTIECLESVLKSTYSNYQVLVVDNSPSDNSINELKLWSQRDISKVKTVHADLVYPLVSKPLNVACIAETDLHKAQNISEKKVLFIKASANNGFAAANNLALNFIRQFDDYGYVWLLNNDTVVAKESLFALLSCAYSDSSKRVGIWGGKLLLYYRRDTLQGVGGRYNRWFGIVKEIGFSEMDTGQWDNKSFIMDYVIGASMFVKKEFIEEVGLMEEDYFLYYEELDWSIRGKRKGWTLGFCPMSHVYHKMGSSINKGKSLGNSLLADFYSSRNRILLTRKYFPYALLTLYPSFIRFVVNRIRLRQFSRILMLMKILINPSKHVDLPNAQ